MFKCETLPEFVDIFSKSNNISFQKGRSQYLLKRWGKHKYDEMDNDNRDKLKSQMKWFQVSIKRLNN